MNKKKSKYLLIGAIIFVFLLILIFFSNSEEKENEGRKVFSKELGLYLLPNDYYQNKKNTNSFARKNIETVLDGINIEFLPLAVRDINAPVEYTHVYSKKCVYEEEWKFAEVAFPNPCLYGDSMPSIVHITNSKDTVQEIYIRLFYQNTSYWHPTNHQYRKSDVNIHLDNFYGSSAIHKIRVEAGKTIKYTLPFLIGMDPKREFKKSYLGTPRPGNYEFALIVLDKTDDLLLSKNLDLKKVNPFVVLKSDELSHEASQYYDKLLYVPSHHFKFVFLNEKFDGKNDLTPQHVYNIKDRDEKELTPGWDGKYKDYISETWNTDDFFKGPIEKAEWIHAPYGNRKENVSFEKNNCVIKIPKSTPKKKQKTWGEIMFGPSFKYGHLSVRAKFSQMINAHITPNGIIHNLWLYETGNLEPVSPDHKYAHLTNNLGEKRFEIDFELWTCLGKKEVWNNNIEINYSIVDYMKNENGLVQLGDSMIYNKLKYDRWNDVQLNIKNKGINKSFLNDFHVYEIIWSPQEVQMLIDGKLKARFDNKIGIVPNKHMNLWIGSPMYQDGTYFDQRKIPFLKEDKFSIIDWIKIE